MCSLRSPVVSSVRRSGTSARRESSGFSCMNYFLSVLHHSFAFYNNFWLEMSFFTLFFGQKYFLYTMLLVAPGHQFLVCVYFSHSYATEPILRKYKNAQCTQNIPTVQCSVVYWPPSDRFRQDIGQFHNRKCLGFGVIIQLIIANMWMTQTHKDILQKTAITV